MRSWKSFTSTLAVALVLAGTVAAQPPRGPGGPGGPGGPPGAGPIAIERILDDLKLTDKQKDKADEVLNAHHEKMRKALDQGRDDLVKEMKDVLTEDQLKKFNDVLTTQGPGRGPGGPGGPGGPPPGGPAGPPPGGPERVLDDLKLSDKQKAKAQDVLKAHMEKMRKQTDQVRDDLVKGMKDVLDANQFTRFKAALEQGPGGPGGSGGPRGFGSGGPGGIERILDDLRISKQERNKAEEAIKAHQEKVQKALNQARDELLKQMREILPDDQYKKFKDGLEQGPPGPQRGRDGGPRDRPGRL
jgi:Spy/CpxP family protein refolding chaperone